MVNTHNYVFVDFLRKLNFSVYFVHEFLQCFDTVGYVIGR